MNIAAISGRIPFDINVFGSDDNPVVIFNVSVQRSYKKEGEEFYPEDLITCKAFGSTAKFVQNYFEAGDAIELTGEIRKDDNYEKDGEMVYGQLYFHINQVKFPPRGKNNSGESNGGGSKKNKGGSTTKKAPKKQSQKQDFVDPFANL